MWYLEELKSKIQEIVGQELVVTSDIPKERLAWLAVPVFKLAAKEKRPVADLMQELKERIESAVPVEVQVEGGFVNISPSLEAQSRIIEESTAANYGSTTVDNQATIIIEYSAPNVAKPMGIGHLRSTVIGDSLRRIFFYRGYQVVGLNHLGDWGTQFGKILVAYQKKFGDLKPRAEITVNDLLDLYIEFHHEAKTDPEQDDEARLMFKRLEEGDPESVNLWQHLVDVSMTEFQKIYDRLGIEFDEPKLGESHYRTLAQEIIDQAVRDSIAKESDGALIVDLPQLGTPLILRKKDGTTIYATRDLAAIKSRVEKYRPKKMFYVVANEQSLHFQQVFAVAEKLKLAEGVQLEHVKFGLVRMLEGKMSTRRGRTILLESVLGEAVKRAQKVVASKNPELDPAEQEAIAEKVGIGAVKYFDLFHDRNHDIVFDWEKILSLKGDSSPYVQYSYARAASILRKAPSNLPKGEELIVEEESQLLIKELSFFPGVIAQAEAEQAPHKIAQYLNRLATQFNQYYEQVPVLKAPETRIVSRLALVRATANVIRIGLDLLGIEVLEEL